MWGPIRPTDHRARTGREGLSFKDRMTHSVQFSGRCQSAFWPQHRLPATQFARMDPHYRNTVT